MSLQRALQTTARVVLLLLCAAAPLSLGRFADWEAAALLLTASLATLLWLLGGGRLFPTLTIADYLLGAAFLASCLITARSVYLYDSLLALGLLLGGLLTFGLSRACLQDGPWRRVGWWSLVAGATAAGLWGAREYNANVIFGGNTTWRAFGPFYNPNCLGGYMALLLPASLALALGAQTRATVPVRPSRHKQRAQQPASLKPRYQEIAGIASAAVMGLALLCTQSKGALLAALVGLLVTAMLGAEARTSRGRAVRCAAVGLAAVAVLGALAFPPVRRRLQATLGTQQHSGSFRLHTWRGTADMIRARPLTGFGPGTFAHAYPRFARAGFTRQAHQTPLQVLAEHGILAGGLLLAAVASAIWVVGCGAARSAGAGRLCAAAAVGGAASLWVHNLVDYTWYVAAFAPAFWGMLGLAWPRGAPSIPGVTSPRLRAIGILCLGVLLAWSATATYSEAQRSTARALAAAGAYDLAQARLERVLPLDACRWIELSRLRERAAAWGDPKAVEDAIAYRQRAVGLQPTEPTNYTALGRLYALQGDVFRALAALQRGVELYPNSPEALLALAQFQERMGRAGEALKTYQRLVGLWDTPVRTAQAVEYFVEPAYAYGWLALAQDAVQRKRPAEVMLLATKALRHAVSVVRTQRAYRQILQAGGRYDARQVEDLVRVAEQCMAILRGLRQPLAELRVGLALEGLERWSEAIRILEPLASEAGPAQGALNEPVRAYAQLALARCLAHEGANGRAAALQAAGRELAGQVLNRLAAKTGLVPRGWDEEDAAGLRTAIQAAPSSPETGAWAVPRGTP